MSKLIDTLIMSDGTIKRIDKNYNLDESNHIAEMNHNELMTYVQNYKNNPNIVVPSIEETIQYIQINFKNEYDI